MNEHIYHRTRFSIAVNTGVLYFLLGTNITLFSNTQLCNVTKMKTKIKIWQRKGTMPAIVTKKNTRNVY